MLFLFNSRGSAIAKIVGRNAVELPDFNDRVTMYVFEEMIEGKKLTEIINETHENVKYLPGHKLPPNVVSITIWREKNNPILLCFICAKYYYLKQCNDVNTCISRELVIKIKETKIVLIIS